MKFLWFFTLVLLASIIQSGNALKCFTCNSEIDGCLCEDLFEIEYMEGSDSETNLYEVTSDGSKRPVPLGDRSADHFVECPEKPENYTGYTPSAPFCRKIKNYIYDKKKGTILRVSRDCGYNPQPSRSEDPTPVNSCRIMKSDEFHTEICQCFEDGCNSASSLSLGAALATASLLGALYRILY